MPHSPHDLTIVRPPGHTITLVFAQKNTLEITPDSGGLPENILDVKRNVEQTRSNATTSTATPTPVLDAKNTSIIILYYELGYPQHPIVLNPNGSELKIKTKLIRCLITHFSLTRPFPNFSYSLRSRVARNLVF